MNSGIIPQIVQKLKTIDPEKIILFGSYAAGAPTKHSDIDLIVVTSEDYLPRTYRERTDVYLKVSNILSEFKKYVPIDLMVYTKPMYQQFIETGNWFAKEISRYGKNLYEKRNH